MITCLNVPFFIKATQKKSKGKVHRLSLFSTGETSIDSHGRRSHAKSFLEECDCNSTLSVAKHIQFLRSLSLSSLRSPRCYDDSWADYNPPFRFSGVPFSWEHSPGIPKTQTADQADHSLVNHLPLPPSIASPSPRRLKFEEKKRESSGEKKLREDPFFAALIECSKGDGSLRSSKIRSNPKVVSGGISDRFGLISLYCSSKSTGNSFHQIAANDRLCNYK